MWKDDINMNSLSCACRFGHLVTYAASYYAYPYAKFLASAIWEKSFVEDPFCRDAGKLSMKLLLPSDGFVLSLIGFRVKGHSGLQVSILGLI